jgi:hypothetical protein
VRATKGLEGKALKRGLKLAESAQLAYENCRQVFIAHERTHGCAPVKTEVAQEKRGARLDRDEGPQESFCHPVSFEGALEAQAVRNLMGWMRHRPEVERLGRARKRIIFQLKTETF